MASAFVLDGIGSILVNACSIAFLMLCLDSGVSLAFGQRKKMVRANDASRQNSITSRAIDLPCCFDFILMPFSCFLKVDFVYMGIVYLTFLMAPRKSLVLPLGISTMQLKLTHLPGQNSREFLIAHNS